MLGRCGVSGGWVWKAVKNLALQVLGSGRVGVAGQRNGVQGRWGGGWRMPHQREIWMAELGSCLLSHG